MKFRYSSDSIREMLLKSLTGKSLDERPEAANWIKDLAVAFRSDLGILALHGISGLTEKLAEQPLIRIPLGGADNLILLLTHHAIQTQQHLGIAVPPGTAMTPMLIVCKILLGDLLDQQEMLGNANRPLSIKEQGGILLVSPDAEMRARYFSMRVGPESVVTSYPACRMRPNGSIVAVSAKETTPNRFSVCFFLAHQKQMPDLHQIAFKPAVVILDLTHDHWIDRMPEMVDWCVHLQNNQNEQTILIALLPYGDRPSRDALSSHGISIFPLDCSGIIELVNGFTPISLPQDELKRDTYRAWSFTAYALEKPQDRRHTIFQIPDNNSADVLEIATYIYQALDGLNEKYTHRDLRLASWLVGTLLQLPIPIQWYEQHAYLMGNRQTLKKLISGIGNNVGGTLYLDIAPVLQSLRGQLELLYTRLSTTNPKSEAFLQYCREHLEHFLIGRKNTALLVRNDVVARALWPWLLSEGIPAEQQLLLHVLTYKQVDGREMFDHMIATGPWPSRYRWQIGGRLGQTMDFLLYRGEEIVLEQQMRSFYSARTQTFCERTRFSMLYTFGDIHNTATQSDRQQADQSDLNLVTVGDRDKIQERMQETSPSYEDSDNVELEVKSLFDLVSLDSVSLSSASSANPTHSEGLPKTPLLHWSGDAFQDSGEQPELSEEDENTLVGVPTETCVLLKVQKASANAANSLQYLYLSKEGTTECYIPSDDDDNLKKVANDEIESGFILIRTDQEDRQTLFDRIVQLADRQPTMKYLRVWREYWLEAIHSLVQKHVSGKTKRGAYLQIQRELAKVGVHITDITIRDWVLGERIGPGNLNSIKAVGTLSQHPMVQQYPRQIDEAFKQIRKIHQVLGRRISTTLHKLGKVAQQGKAIASSRTTKQEIQLDPALSVPIDDLLDMLQYWEVVEVIEGPWNVPLSRVGLVLPRALYEGD